MQQIIAIGGGGFGRENCQFEIEKYILQQSGKENPRIGFLPQASAEAKDYIVRYYQSFCQLGAQPSWFSLFGRVPRGFEKELLQQDIIYVGGGNTKSMLALWQIWGIDKLLRQAYDNGVVLAGVSAGAICWFEAGITDSVWPLGTVECLGFLSGSCCPHFDSEIERQAFYQQQVDSEATVPGIALEENTAVHFVDGKLQRVVTWEEGKSVYTIEKDREAAVIGVESHTID